MKGLHLQLLGGFNIAFDGSPVSGFHQPRLQALLSYIVLNRRQPQPRSAIAFLFWPDSTEKQARTNLRKLVYSLRKALPESDGYLALTTETIGWRNDAPYQLDVAKFEGCLAGTTIIKTDLKEAVAAYRGDLLPGFYDEWILVERERLRSLYGEALLWLSAHFEEERNYLASVTAARRLLELDALQESTYRLLMRLHLLNNDRGAALAVYHQCSTILREELGVDPSPLTAELYERVLMLETAVQDTPRLADSLPLIGRHQEWKQLDQMWRQVQKQGPATLFLIQGEAGIGKTRLAEELVSSTRRLGMTAVHTRAYGAEGAGPYAPVADLLRAVDRAAMLEKLEPVWLTEVARLVPELLDERPDIPPPQPITEGWQRQRFQEGLTRGVLAGGQPLLIHFDDLQWCDPETLTWLRFLLGNDRQRRLLVMGTVRDDEVEPGHHLISLRLEMENKGRCQVIELEPLNPDDVARLAAEVVGKDLSDTQVDRLFSESEGSPLFLIEMLRAGGAEGASEWLEDAASTTNGDRRLPPKVQAVILWRLSQLTPEAQELAAMVAVIGRRFQHELLTLVGDLSEQELVGSLDELWRRRIIREEAAGDYDFSHDRIREVAYGRISPMQRRYLHKRVAKALESIHAPDLDPVSGRIARHFEQADDTVQACFFFAQAGKYAAEHFANKKAAGYFNRALELTNQNEAPGKGVMALYSQLGRVLELDSQFEQAMENYQKMEDSARKHGNQSMLLNSQAAQITLLATPTPVHDLIRGEALANKALILAQNLEDKLAEVKILWNLLLIHGFSGRPSKAISFGERALALARKHKLKEQMAFVLNDLGYRCYLRSDQLKRAREVLEEASELWKELGNLPMLADCLSSLCVVSVDAGEFDLALAYSAEAHQISQSIGTLWGQSFSLMTIGRVHWERGHPDKAIATMEECIRLAEKAGFIGAQFHTRIDLSLVLSDLGAEIQSMDIMRQTIKLTEAQFPNGNQIARAIEARFHLFQGRLTEAEEIIEHVKKEPNWKNRIPETVYFVEAALAYKQQEIKKALSIAKKLAAILRQSESRYFLSEGIHLYGQILEAAGQKEAARQCLQEARAEATAIDSKRMLWRILFSLSLLEIDPIESRHLRQQAREIVNYIADHTGSPALRASFLNQSVVRELLTM